MGSNYAEYWQIFKGLESRSGYVIRKTYMITYGKQHFSYNSCIGLPIKLPLEENLLLFTLVAN